jgi:uncharacterized membrane-anchored protein
MRNFLVVAVIFGLMIPMPALCSDDEQANNEAIEAFLQSMTFHEGVVDLPGGIATIELSSAFRYLNPEDTQRLLEDGWGNPDGSNQIGMLVPMDTDLFSDSGWAVVISYQEDGYVSDEDAAEIDYGEMLASMQEGSEEANKERVAHGFEPVNLVGWAEPPHYDNQTKKLYWAKELKFGDNDISTLNYNVRILGREGVLVMNAVSGVDQLPMIRQHMEEVIAFANFKDGYRYADYNPGVDKVAAYGIAALIGGKVAAKAGLLAKLGGVLLAFKKLFIIGFLAVAGFLSKLFKGRKAEVETGFGS